MPGRKRSRPVLIGFEAQAHRDALHHLDVVAGGVFRRQDAGDGAGAAADVLDVAFKIQLQRVHVNAGRLARLDIVHLRLFEVGRHPDVADLGDHQQLLAGVDALADLGRSLQNNARGRRDDLRIAELQFAPAPAWLARSAGWLAAIATLACRMATWAGALLLVLRQADFTCASCAWRCWTVRAADSTMERLASTAASWALAVAAT